MTVFFLLLTMGFAPTPVGVEEGLRAYREGRFEAAYEIFKEEESRAGDRATPELSYNLALAALKTAHYAEAQAAAGRAAERGGPEFAARHDFIRGNLAFLEAQRAEAMSFGPEGGETALDEGLAACDRAMAAWIAAATSRDDWPEARRNVARARRLREYFATRKDQAAAERQKAKSAAPPPPPDEGEDRPTEEDPGGRPKAMLRELNATEIHSLFDRLEDKERDKRRGRQRRLLPPVITSERDW
ncbi:MAG: hypothetical protein KDB53_03540 [Planctomycetes bacterium]|nr:hypothetical protein [Planctomycetota bacterium]